MKIVDNNPHTAEEIISVVKNAVKEFNNGGDKNDFFRSILQAVKWAGVENFVKATRLSRVEIYDTLDGVNPSFEYLSRILEVFGIKINFSLDEQASQIKKFSK